MALSRMTDFESRKSTTNGYRKIKQIGEGAFGKTFYATKDGQDYALKKLKSFQMTKAVVIATMKEITILRSLKHRNVVSYVESFRDGFNKLCIVMEYCEMGNLGMLIDSRDPSVADERSIVRVMTQLCRGMKYIHNKKVIHRDIKPTNIFVQTGGVIKIGDFGLSKVLQSSGFASTLCGTASYISPECLQGLPYNYQSDMWAVGRVLFDLCHRGAKEWHPRRVTMSRRYSHDLRIILGKLLSPDPRYRLPAVEAMAKFSNMNSTSRSSQGGYRSFRERASAEDRESVASDDDDEDDDDDDDNDDDDEYDDTNDDDDDTNDDADTAAAADDDDEDDDDDDDDVDDDDDDDKDDDDDDMNVD